MKMFIAITIIVMLLLTLTGCEQQRSVTDMYGVISEDNFVNEYISEEESHTIIATPEFLEFSSLDEFLEVHRSARSSEVAEDISVVAERLDIASVERLYLPTGILEEYELFCVMIDLVNVGLLFLPSEHLVSDGQRSDAVSKRQHFIFTFSRESFEYPMSGIMEQFGATETDLLDGRYLFVEPNSYLWGYDGRILCLQLPMPPDIDMEYLLSAPIDEFESWLQALPDDIALSLGLDDRNDLTRFMTVDIFDIQD